MTRHDIRALFPAIAVLTTTTLFAPFGLSAQTATQDDEPEPIGFIAPAMQIALAVQSAPMDLRDGATVQGYDAEGTFVTLREGTNEMICMAPAPTSTQFEVSCHHSDLEPFFERGRELRASGIDGAERTQARWDEIEAGTLPMPFGSTNYITTADGFNAETGEIQNPWTRWVIYTPNATPETTGLTTQAATSQPWLMFSGTPGAHIMISPPRGGGDR